METNYSVQIQLGILLYRVGGVHWNEVGCLGEAVENNLDGIMLQEGHW